jgi:hypothetical protein
MTMYKNWKQIEEYKSYNEITRHTLIPSAVAFGGRFPMKSSVKVLLFLVSVEMLLVRFCFTNAAAAAAAAAAPAGTPIGAAGKGTTGILKGTDVPSGASLKRDRFFFRSGSNNVDSAFAIVFVEKSQRTKQWM